MRAVINSEKRILQVTLSSVATGTTGYQTLVKAEQSVGSTDPTSVAAGSVVKAVYLELWILAGAQQPATTTTIVYKLATGADNPSSVDMGNLNAWVGKKNILESHQGLVGDANSNPIPFYRGWIKIPKGKQRFGLGDQLNFAVKSITDSVEFCGIAIFKVYN